MDTLVDGRVRPCVSKRVATIDRITRGGYVRFMVGFCPERFCREKEFGPWEFCLKSSIR